MLVLTFSPVLWQNIVCSTVAVLCGQQHYLGVSGGNPCAGEFITLNFYSQLFYCFLLKKSLFLMNLTQIIWPNFVEMQKNTQNQYHISSPVNSEVQFRQSFNSKFVGWCFDLADWPSWWRCDSWADHCPVCSTCGHQGHGWQVLLGQLRAVRTSKMSRWFLPCRSVLVTAFCYEPLHSCREVWYLTILFESQECCICYKTVLHNSVSNTSPYLFPNTA